MAVGSHVHSGAWVVFKGRDRWWRRTGRQRRLHLSRRLLARPVLRGTLPRVCRVRITLPGAFVVQWNVRLVALAHLDGRGALARAGLTRIVARPTHIEHRVLRQPAVKVALRRLRVVLEAGGPLLLGRQKSGGTGRRPAEGQIEAQVGTEISLVGVPGGDAERV